MPIVVGLVDVFFLRRNWRAAVRSLWPWIVVALPYVILTKSIQPDKPFDVEVPYWTRPFIAADAVTFYLYKIIFPAWLGLFYGRHAGVGAEARRDLLHVARAGGDRGRVLAAAAKLRPLIGAALIFLAALAPVSGLVRFNSQQFSTVWDHYLYLPMFGVALCGGVGAARPWCREPRRRGQVTLLCAALLAALAAQDVVPGEDVARHAQALFQNARRVNPNVMEVR